MAKKSNSTQPTFFINPFTRVYGSGDPLIILVGTMGGASAGSHPYTFPFSDSNNYMWCLLPALYGESSLKNASDVEKEVFLIRHRIVMYDICKSAKRTGSADSTITEEKVNDFNKIVKKYPNAKIVCVGNKAHELFVKHFPYISISMVWSTSGISTNKGCEEILTSFKNSFFEKDPNLDDIHTMLNIISTCKSCKNKKKTKNAHQTIKK